MKDTSLQDLFKFLDGLTEENRKRAIEFIYQMCIYHKNYGNEAFKNFCMQRYGPNVFNKNEDRGLAA